MEWNQMGMEWRESAYSSMRWERIESESDGDDDDDDEATGEHNEKSKVEQCGNRLISFVVDSI